MSDGTTGTLTGGCQCGAVRYRLSARPVGSICHCRMCQKAVGGPFAALAEIAVGHLEWTAGALASFRSSSMATRGFCAACGTPLTYQGDGSKTIEVTIGSLDDPSLVPPRTQAGIEGRLSWLDTLPSLPATPTDAKYDGLVNFQGRVAT